MVFLGIKPSLSLLLIHTASEGDLDELLRVVGVFGLGHWNLLGLGPDLDVSQDFLSHAVDDERSELCPQKEARVGRIALGRG